MDWQGFNNAIISFKIFMDDQVSVVSRRTYKIADAMGDVGGFMGVVYIIGMIFVANFQSFIYKSNILSSLYLE